MKQLALQALDSTQRSSISYADVRVAESRDRELATKNRRPGQVSGTESAGLGIRALADGCWGFAATDDLSKSGVESATTLARSSGLARTQDVALAVIFQNTVEP
jgi:TldD protein